MNRVLLFAASLLLLAGCAAQTPQPEVEYEPRTTRAPRSDEINIDYPVFPEYSGFVNVAIREAAYSVLGWYDLDFFEPEERLTLDIEYKVKLKTDGLLSIVFRGLGYIMYTAHPNNLLYTLNLDVQTGEPVRLADRVLMDEALADALHKAAKETLEPEAYELYKQDYIDCAYEEGHSFLTELAGADTEGTAFYSCFTPDRIGVVLPCKASSNYHYELEISLGDINLAD